MNDLPTLWVYGPSLTQAMATPADRVARVSAFLRRDHDESREHEFVPAARLDAANLEIARLRLALQAEHRRCVAGAHDVAQKHRKPDGTRTVEGYGALDAWDALASAKPDVFRTITPKEPSDV